MLIGLIVFLLLVFGGVWLYNRFFGCGCKDKATP